MAAIEATAAQAKPQTGAELLVRALELEEVEYIFGVPGEENLDLLEAIRTSSIKFIVTRHEQVAGFMASTYGRLTGKPGVARAYGAIGVRIASADGLIPALEMAFEEGGIHLVVAAIDYSENHRVFFDELNSKKAMADNTVA